MRQKLVQFGVQATGYVVTLGVVVLLVLAWTLTSPLVWLGDWLASNRKQRGKIIGAAFVMAGIILVVYGINASSSASSAFSQIFNGAPANKTQWILLGGCAAVIVGAVMIFHSSVRARMKQTKSMQSAKPPCALQ
ncbi:MAG TPA: DUF3185 family protein [Candidatus Aquilonibacter sp.]|nr:DUF3185 family protein [Candidatus Aquilonibacter sp.]